MARVSATQRLIVEDFPDQKEWIGPMFDTINEFITKVLAEVNGRVEFAQNIAGVEKELDFVFVNAATSFPQTFAWTLGLKPKALYVVSALENNPSVNRLFTPVIVNVAWQLNNLNQIEVTDAVKLSSGGVSSLTASRRYKILLRVTP